MHGMLAVLSANCRVSTYTKRAKFNASVWALTKCMCAFFIWIFKLNLLLFVAVVVAAFFGSTDHAHSVN